MRGDERHDERDGAFAISGGARVALQPGRLGQPHRAALLSLRPGQPVPHGRLRRAAGVRRRADLHGLRVPATTTSTITIAVAVAATAASSGIGQAQAGNMVVTAAATPQVADTHSAVAEDLAVVTPVLNALIASIPREGVMPADEEEEKEDHQSASSSSSSSSSSALAAAAAAAAVAISANDLSAIGNNNRTASDARADRQRRTNTRRGRRATASAAAPARRRSSRSTQGVNPNDKWKFLGTMPTRYVFFLLLLLSGVP